jgi:hypothetical protein
MPTPGAPRRAAWPDSLYGSVRTADWVAALLATPPFLRLAGISLSSVPGELLFGRPFPSRLEHARGVYHLARLARPRDRVLQAAALAHDLGHGPFSHLCEPLMREWLGCNHEERAARQLAAVRAALPETLRRRLAWLDWDEVAALVVGDGADGRGALLNGRLDYDNADNVARYLIAAGMGEPGYDPVALARALRLLPHEGAPDGAGGEQEGGPARGRRGPVYLLALAEGEALAWQAARTRLYGFLHGDHLNLAPYGMLRKAVELAHASDALPKDFLEMTDAQALDCLASNAQSSVAQLAGLARAGRTHWHICRWESEQQVVDAAAHHRLADWRARLALEAELASEAGLAPQAVILVWPAPRAARTLPPVGTAGRPGVLRQPPRLLPAPLALHVLVAAETPRDYLRRLCAAIERRLGALGVVGAMASAPDRVWR